MERGWSPQRGAFVQHYGSQSLDAANLMMALTFFLAPTHPRMPKTLDATLQSPKVGGLLANGLVYRYNTIEAADGLSGEEGTLIFARSGWWRRSPGLDASSPPG